MKSKSGKKKIFSEIEEKDITHAIVSGFMKMLEEYSSTDVIVLGAGPAGLVAAKELAKNGVKVLVIERNNYLGGGFWIGGYLMNTITVRAPGHKILEEIGVKLQEVKPGLFITHGPEAVSKLIASACDAGVKFLQMTSFDDLVIKDGRVSGVVVNWTPVSALPREITCVDPVALECKFLIDATGHDAYAVKSLEARGLVKTKGMGAMWVEMSEDLIVEHTGEVFPGLYVVGMAVSETYGLPRMGPTFGGVLMSGKRAAEIIIDEIKKEQQKEKRKQQSK
ncbi:MAG: sulfide-dependent adenosine diphosphate thiazole synthase [Candidatus Calescibacterium sp.]